MTEASVESDGPAAPPSPAGRRRVRLWWFGAAALAVAAAVGVFAIVVDDGSRYLKVEDDPPYPMTSDSETETVSTGSEQGDEATFGGVGALNATSRAITIHSVEPVVVDPGVEVLGVRVALAEDVRLGSARGWRSELGEEPDGFVVPGGAYMNIIAGLRSLDGSDAGVHGFRIRYESGGTLYEVEVEHSFVLSP